MSGDFYAIEDLATRLTKNEERESQGHLFVRPMLTLADVLRQMSNYQFIVTSRFHGVIFSQLLSKPVIALSYLPKIHHLMRTAGVDRFCFDADNLEKSPCAYREISVDRG